MVLHLSAYCFGFTALTTHHCFGPLIIKQFPWFWFWSHSDLNAVKENTLVLNHNVFSHHTDLAIGLLIHADWFFYVALYYANYINLLKTQILCSNDEFTITRSPLMFTFNPLSNYFTAHFTFPISPSNKHKHLSSLLCTYQLLLVFNLCCGLRVFHDLLTESPVLWEDMHAIIWSIGHVYNILICFFYPACLVFAVDSVFCECWSLHHLWTFSFYFSHQAFKCNKEADRLIWSRSQNLVNHRWAWRGCWLSLKHIRVIMQVTSLICHWPF